MELPSNWNTFRKIQNLSINKAFCWTSATMKRCSKRKPEWYCRFKNLPSFTGALKIWHQPPTIFFTALFPPVQTAVWNFLAGFQRDSVLRAILVHFLMKSEDKRMGYRVLMDFFESLSNFFAPFLRRARRQNDRQAFATSAATDLGCDSVEIETERAPGHANGRYRHTHTHKNVGATKNSVKYLFFFFRNEDEERENEEEEGMPPLTSTHSRWLRVNDRMEVGTMREPFTWSPAECGTHETRNRRPRQPHSSVVRLRNAWTRTKIR